MSNDILPETTPNPQVTPGPAISGPVTPGEARRGGYYVLIPDAVLHDRSLPANARLLYGDIVSLCRRQGYCWAGNEHFVRNYSVTKRTVQQWIEALRRAGLIVVSIVKGWRRQIRLAGAALQPPPPPSAPPPSGPPAAAPAGAGIGPKIGPETGREIAPSRAEICTLPAQEIAREGANFCTNTLITNIAMNKLTDEAPAAPVAAPPPEPTSQLVGELVSFGVSLAEAERLAARYGEDSWRRVLCHVPDKYDTPLRKLGWMLKALALDWQVGKPPREWKINGGEDLDALIADYGRLPVVLEVERRASGRDLKPELAERRRLTASYLRAGMTGVAASLAAVAALAAPQAPAG